MSKSIAQGVVLTLLMMGNEESGYLREICWAAMLAVWLSFEGLLRPGETMQLLTYTGVAMKGWSSRSKSRRPAGCGTHNSS